jgi:hypothetical protein
MNQNKVKTYKYKIGKKTYVVIQITQSATAKSPWGNALASNQANVRVFTKKKKKKKRHDK